MNEDLLKDLVKLKVKIAHTIIDSLPQELADTLISFEKIVIDTLKEECEARSTSTTKKPAVHDHLHHVEIE